MRKSLSMILACSLAASLAFTGCGQSASTATPASSATESASEEEVISENAAPSATEEPVDDTTEFLEKAAAIQNPSEDYADVIRDVAYIDDGEDYHKVDLYGTSSPEKLPVVIEVHGGGFVGGDRAKNTSHCEFFAERGYKVVATDYPRIPRNGDFKDSIQALFTSYQWVADHADEYGFDMSRVLLSGDSAGGYYVLLSCAISNSEELQQYFDITLPSFDFNGYVTTCPLADIRSMQDDLHQDNGPNAHIAQAIGANLLLDEDLMSHLDLMQSVDATAFEGLYMLTTPDDTVTGKAVLTFDQYLTDNNVDHVTVSYDSVENDIGHTFNISHPDFSESKVANQDMVDYCDTLISK